MPDPMRDEVQRMATRYELPSVTVGLRLQCRGPYTLPRLHPCQCPQPDATGRSLCGIRPGPSPIPIAQT